MKVSQTFKMLQANLQSKMIPMNAQCLLKTLIFKQPKKICVNILKSVAQLIESQFLKKNTRRNLWGK